MENESNAARKRRAWLVGGIIAIVLAADQALKIWVKTHMQIGEDIPLLGTWCRLHFIENEGMAFGMAFGGKAGKLALSLFRIAASGAILWYILRMIRRGSRMLPLASLALIFVGAVGNLVDSCFYGLLFNESYYHVATFLPPEGGYAGFLFGKVVDMFYFPLFQFTWPQWVPGIGGRHFEFFNAIFNVADSAITLGVIMLLIDQLFIAPKRDKIANLQHEEGQDARAQQVAE